MEYLKILSLKEVRVRGKSEQSMFRIKRKQMSDLNTTILTSTLQLNGLYIPIKRQRLLDWILKKQDSVI